MVDTTAMELDGTDLVVLSDPRSGLIHENLPVEMAWKIDTYYQSCLLFIITFKNLRAIASDIDGCFPCLTKSK